MNLVRCVYIMNQVYCKEGTEIAKKTEATITENKN